MRRRVTIRKRAGNEEQESGLRALVELANANLDAAKDGDVESLTRGLFALIPGAQPFGGGLAIQVPADDVGRTLLYTLSGPLPPTLEDARNQLRELQSPVRQLLTVAVSRLSVPSVRPTAGVSTEGSLTADFLAMPAPGGRGPIVTVSAPFRDLVLLRTLDLLVHPLIRERLRSCPECNAFFLRVKRQEFCSEQCKSRANFRRRRTRELTDAQRLRRADRAHKYYEQKQRRLHGNPRLKVQRRPRVKWPIKDKPRRKSR